MEYKDIEIDVFCPLHPSQSITHLNIASGCTHRLVCKKCRNESTGLDIDTLIPIKTFSNQDTLKKVLEQVKLKTLDLIQTRTSGVEKINKYIDESKALLIELLENTRKKMINQLVSNVEDIQSKLDLCKTSFTNFFQKNIGKSFVPHAELSNIARSYCYLMNSESSKITFNDEKFKDMIRELTTCFQTYTKNIIKYPQIPDQTIEDFSFKKLKEGKNIKYINGSAPCGVHTLRFIPERDVLIVGDINGYIRVFSGTTHKLLSETRVHQRDIACIRYVPKKNIILSIGFDNYIKVSYLHPNGSLKVLKTLDEHKLYATGLLVNEDEHEFYSCGWDHDIRIWDLDTFRLKGKICTSGKDKMGSEILHIRKYSLLIVGFYEGKLGVYDLKTKKELQTIETGRGAYNMNSLTFLENLNMLYARVATGKIRCWDLIDNKLDYNTEFDVGNGSPVVVAINQHQVLVATGGSDIILLEAKERRMINSRPLDLLCTVSFAFDVKRKKLYVGDFKSTKIAALEY